MSINLRILIQRLILLGLLLTPLFSVGEVYALLSGLVESQGIAYTPVYIKAGKDLIFLAIAFAAIVASLRSGRTSLAVVPFLILVAYLFAVSLLASILDPRLILAGFRWIAPLLVSLLIVRFVDEAFLGRIARLACLLFPVHLFLQVLQLFFMSAWYGTTYFGLAGRVPGFFFIPSTAGFFSVCCLYLAIFHLPNSRLRKLILVTAPISTLLTQSGTGVVVLALLALLLVVGVRKAPLLVPALPILAAFFMFALPALTGRGSNYVEESGGTRLEIFLELLEGLEWLPSAFGFATNTAVGFGVNLSPLEGTRDYSMIVDSTYGSIIGNLGLPGLISLLCLGIWWTILLVIHRRMDLYAFTLIFGLYGMTTIVTEAYPMSLLFTVLLAFYLGLPGALISGLRPEPGSSRTIGGFQTTGPEPVPGTDA